MKSYSSAWKGLIITCFTKKYGNALITDVETVNIIAGDAKQRVTVVGISIKTLFLTAKEQGL